MPGLRTVTGSRSRPPKGFYFDAKEAESAVRFIEARCHHWQDPYQGKRFILEPWQRELIEDLFGWKRADGSLRYRWGYVEVPKGNGKTPLGAAIVLLALHWSGEVGAEVYSAAGDREQARLIYADARGMTLESPELTSRSVLYTNQIKIPETNSTYKVLSADAPTKHGFRPSLVVVDELHVQPNRKLFDTLKAGVIKRPNAMLISLTTAGEYDEESLCWNEHEYAVACCKGEIDDPAYYAVVYAADKDDDPGDEKTWIKSNPNYGVTVLKAGLEDEYRRAKFSPMELASFKQLHLNIWAESLEGVIDIAKWDKCSAPPEPEGECYIGLDLSSKLDLTSAVAYFPANHSVLVKFWIPEEDLRERIRRDVFDYKRHIESGLIVATEGNLVDQTAIRNQIVEWGDTYELIDIGFDPWNATQMSIWLGDEEGFEVTEVRQGTKTLSEPMKAMVGYVKNEELRHGGNPVLRWNALNLKAQRDPNDNWRPVKHGGGSKRIDGMVALIMAIERALGHADEQPPMVYSEDEDETS